MTTAPGPARRPPGRRFGLAGRWFRLPERWIRQPRRTVRLRLTAVYGALFLLLGAALLGITYLLVSKELPGAPGMAGTATSRQPGSAVVFHTTTGNCRLTASPPPPLPQLQRQAQKCLSEQ